MAKIELELDESLSQFVKGLRGTSDGQRDRKLNTIVSDYVDQEELKEELREIHEQLGKILNMPSTRTASRGKMFWTSYARSLAKRLTLATETE